MECKAHQNHCDAQNSSSYVLSCLEEDLICYHHYDIDGGRKMMICESYTPITTTTSAMTTTSTTHTPTSTLVTTRGPTTVVSASDVRTSTTTMPPSTTTQSPSLRALTNTSSAKQIQKTYVLKQSNRTSLAASPPAQPEYIYVDNHSDVAIWACIVILMLLQLYQILRNKTCTRRPRKISNPPPVNNQQFQRNSWSNMPPVQHMRREQKRRERKTKLREIVNGNGVPKPPPTSESLMKNDAPPLPSRPAPKHSPPSAEDGLKTLNALRGTAKLKQQMRRLHESQKT